MLKRAVFWPVMEKVTAGGISLAVVTSLGSVILGHGRGEQLREAFAGALSLWARPPWAALAAVFSRFGEAVHTSATSMDPAVVTYGWTIILYGFPYLLVCLTGMVVRALLMGKRGPVLQRSVGALSGLALAVFDVCLYTFAASWIAMFVQSLIYGASTAGT